MLLNHAALSRLHESLRDQAELTSAWLRHLLSWLWFLGTAVPWGYGRSLPHLRRTVWDHCLSPGSWSSLRAAAQYRVHLSQQQPRFESSAVRARWSAESARQPGYCTTSPSCLRHASCPLSVLCSAARCAFHLRAQRPHETTNRARTYARAQSTHPSQLMSIAHLLTQYSACASALADAFVIRMLAALTSPHKLRRTQPGPPGSSKLSLEGRLVHW